MKNRILFLLLVIIPVSLLVWFAWRAQSNEQLAAQQQYQNLVHSQLKIVDGKVASYFQQLEIKLMAQQSLLNSVFLSDDEAEGKMINRIRDVVKRSAYISGIYVEDSEKNILFPSPSQTLSENEQSFLTNIRSISRNRSLFNEQKEQNGDTGQSLQQQPQQILQQKPVTASRKLSPLSRSLSESDSVAQQQGWIAWYQDRNLHHIFWFKDVQKRLYLLSLDRVRILSEIIALLPETTVANERYENYLNNVSIRLYNSNDEVVYEWGSYVVDQQQSIDMMLSYPLSSWKLSWYSKELSEKKFHKTWSILLIALLASILFMVLMSVFYREYRRDIRLAQQRVNFVSQVSHELKTPLTNIRMYAELLETNIKHVNQDAVSKSQHFLSVIINESQRLSRLIDNVLSFAKVQKQSIRINKRLAIVDECIDNVLISFRPIFEQKNITINFSRGADSSVSFDAQILEQILNNLLSNVEKYAAQGRRLDIKSTQVKQVVAIEIRDYGSGVSKTEQKKIFRPFYRSSSQLTEGVSGTGIGLTISRQLAELHGGRLGYKEVEQGACFVIELYV